MKVKKLDINNFRGFGEATIEFPDSNLAVFIGTNGQGKSSVLDLVAMFLTKFTHPLYKLHNLKFPKKQDYEIGYFDINSSSPSSSTVNSIWLSAGGNPYLNNSKEEFLIKLDVFASTFVPKGSDTNKNLLLDFIDGLKSKLIFNKKASFSVFLYYRTNRYFSNIYKPLKNEISYDIPQLAAYENAFSKKITNFDDFVNWFRIEEDKENELIKKERNFDLTNPNLQIVRKSITEFFSKLNASKFINLRIERELPEGQVFSFVGSSSSLVITKNDQDLRLEQLSDGEKMLLLVVCDIARRLSIANPGVDNPLEGTGIVLIDEIELHLHPKWQREVIPALLTTFPGIQFIVTTHSPQVLSQVDQSDIFLLKDGEIRPVSSNPKGLDTNAILEEIMDTPKYPKEVDDLVGKLFILIQQKQFEKAEAVREQLKAASPDNPALSRADSMMERLKVLYQ